MASRKLPYPERDPERSEGEQSKDAPPQSRRRRVSALALVDANPAVEQLQRLVARALEGVAADDRAVAAAVADGARLGEDAAVVLGLAAGEHDDAPPVEAGLDDMAIARRGRGDVDLLLLIDLFGGVELEEVGGRLDLDDVRAQERRHMRGIGADVDRRLALLRQAAAARIGPDHHGEAMRLGLAPQ